MLPLTSERVKSGHIDMDSTRQQWGLDPDRLYWIFDACLSKLDPNSIDLFLSALKRAPKNVSLWFLGSPTIAEANIYTYMRNPARWSPCLNGRVIFGQHLPKDDHFSRLAALCRGGKALFLNSRLSWSAHTTCQEVIAMGGIPFVLLDKTSAFQGRAGGVMNMFLGLGSLVASTPDDFEELLIAWSQEEKSAERERLSHEFRSCFVNQTGFWDQHRSKDELLNAF
jgi:predicted O-linked N-acetylglucosamine transferase (SPINDLY family)